MKRNLVLFIMSILFLGSLQAQNHYTPVDHSGTYGFGVWAQVFLDGELQTSTDIEIGMFFDDDCVATDRVQDHFSGNLHNAVNLYCTNEGGNAVTFKLYNHATEEELSYSYGTTPASDVVIGGPGNLYDLVFNHTYEIAASANPTEGGTVAGAGTYVHGSSVTLTATPNEDYNFVNWTENGEEVSTDAEYTFDVTAARTLVANFEVIPYGPTYPWSVSPEVSDGSNGYIIAIVQINGETITDGTNWEVGAFNGDACHGVGSIDNNSWVDTSDDPITSYDCYLMMMLYGHGGEELTFYLYDRESGATLPGVCDVTVTYTADCAFGDFDTPYILNFVTTQTFTLDITGYGEGDGHYYLIASPIGEVNPNQVGDMFKYERDLYYFDQDHELEWINIRDGNTNLFPGKGYLYASKQDVTLTFYGSPYNGNSEVVLVKDAANNPDGGFEGWNLVGNPFAQTAYIDRDYYTMNADGDEIVAAVRANYAIEPMVGIFVIAEEDGETMTFSTEPNNDKVQGQIVLNLSHNRGNVIDRTIVRFGEGGMLPKLQIRDNSTKVYIPQDGNDFAIVRTTEAGELPVNFKAAQNGTYTISVNAEDVDVNYLHLIDNQTGEDIDLLQASSYTFNALTTDYASRFKLVFATGANTEDTFSFYSNGNWFINNDGNATLQVVDVTGRIMSSEEISGCYSKHIEAAPGVYMLRLINGNDMKVQKIVIK